MSDSSDNPTLKFLVRRRTTFTWLVPLGLLIATYYVGSWSLTAVLLGFILLALGEFVRFWAAGYIHKDNVIATTGPYALVRNPLYFGSLLLALGYLLISGLNWPAWLIVIGLFLLFHLAAITYEENFLKREFGEPYFTYLKRVPRLLPRLMPALASSGTDPGAASPTRSGSFAPSQAVYNREHITAGITVLTAFVFVAMHYFARGHYGVQP